MLLAVKNTIPSHALDTPSELETLCVQIGSGDFVTMCLVYIPPSSSELYIQSSSTLQLAIPITSAYYLGISIFLQSIGIHFRVKPPCQIFFVT